MDNIREQQPPIGRMLDDQLAKAYREFEAELSKDRAPATVETVMQGIRGFFHYLRTGRAPGRFEQVRWPLDERAAGMSGATSSGSGTTASGGG